VIRATLADGASALSGEAWASLLPAAEVSVDGSRVEVRSAVDPSHATLWSEIVFARDDLLAAR
jgi:hypothetical protein